MKRLAIATLGVLAMASPALAHHPFDAEFDQKSPVVLTGTVKQVDWILPHVLITLDVKDKAGKVQTWKLEAGSPDDLKKAGWKDATSLAKGSQITVHGYKAKLKNEPYTISARSLDLPGGKKISAAANDGGPKT